MKLTFPALFSCLLPAVASAQSIVSPAHFTTAEGPSSASHGIGVTTSPADLLSIHEELQGTARTVRGVAFRLDGITNPSGSASSLSFNLFASTAVTTAANPNATFSANHGADKVQVGNFVSVSWPAPQQKGPTNPFDYAIPFAQPFAFGGAGPLCVEIQVVSRNNSTLRFDYAVNASTDPNPVVRTYGTGCKATGNTSNASVSGSASGNWPSKSVSLGYSAARLPASAGVVLILGGSNALIAGLPLPIQLPGTSGAASGACTVYNDILVQVPSVASASGAASWNIGLPVNPFFNGLSIFGQVWAIDMPANNWHVVSTSAAHHHIVAPYLAPKIGTVYSNTSTVMGTVLTDEGFVLRIDV